MRKPGEVAFPDNSWLIRYFDQIKWHSIREDTVTFDLHRYFGDDSERLIDLAKQGMSIETPYAEYIFIREPAFQDELPMNYRLPPGKAERIKSYFS